MADDNCNANTPIDDEETSSPMAFTVQFDDPMPDKRKLKIHDKLSSFALKHRRNPSLPEFKSIRTSRTSESPESVPVPPITNKVGRQYFGIKHGYHSEGYFSSDQDDESLKQKQMISKSFLESKTAILNGTLTVVKSKGRPPLRRSSMNDMEINKILKPSELLNKTFTMEELCSPPVEAEDKSDTVSEAGTYTVDKDQCQQEKVTENIVDPDNAEEDKVIQTRKSPIPENQKWINDWVKKVAEESFLNAKDSLSASGSSSPSASKIPSPVSTLPKIRDSRKDRTQPKINNHRRSSSLSSKEFTENRMSDSSLETESYLRTTESVVAAMQSRMKLNLKLNLNEEVSKKQAARKERLHPPSTASDTDTNSENESKVFKKPSGTPFSSARLNRAFSLRRARTDSDTETKDQKKTNAVTTPAAVPACDKRQPTTRLTPSPQAVKPKANSPFARTDCGRFSMRSLSTVSKSSTTVSPVQKKEIKAKNSGGPRCNSSLSSREVEFQNWKRRKSFDPMKAAAEGRKKEAAKKMAAVSPSAMTQSVNLGTSVQPRTGNPVLRSASFHTSLHPSSPHLNNTYDLSPDEDESAGSSAYYKEPTLPPNSPTKPVPMKASLVLRPGVSSSRVSLNSAVSETHSSPSRRARSELIDNLLISAISDISIKLKSKSSHLMRKLDVCCGGDDDRLIKIKEELSNCDSQKGSANSSPSHKSATRDFPAILKNLKSIENMLHILDDVLFGDDEIDDD